MSDLEKIIQLLKDNKKFPNYQAERRIDIFLNVFLEELLSVYLGKEVKYVCPEFPLRQDGDYNRSTKLDYLCKTEGELLFIELKTDNKSFNEDQLDTYFTQNWETWLSKLEDIMEATKDTVKYQHLKNTLMDCDLYHVKYKNAPIRVIYISPKFSTKNIKRLEEMKYSIGKEMELSKANISTAGWDTISPLFSIDGEELCTFEIEK